MYTASCVFALQLLGAMASLPTWNVDYSLALKRAEAANKPLAVFIAPGRGGTMAAAAERKLSSEARRLLMNHYVCVYIDASLPTKQGLVESFEAGGLPLVVLSSPDRVNQAFRHPGRFGDAELVQALQRHTSESSAQRVREEAARQAVASVAVAPVSYAAPCRT